MTITSSIRSFDTISSIYSYFWESLLEIKRFSKSLFFSKFIFWLYQGRRAGEMNEKNESGQVKLGQIRILVQSLKKTFQLAF
jgi:hypothetical protein